MTFLILQELANLPTLELIQNDGSPSARKLFILWNPIACPKTVCALLLYVIYLEEVFFQEICISC